MAEPLLPGEMIDSIIDLSAYNPAARSDPHPMLRSLREACPVFRDEAGKVWFLSRMRDVRDTVNDRDLVRHPAKADPESMSARFLEEGGETRPPSILFLDDPDHARIRQPLAKAFYARVNRMRGEIEAMIDTVIAGLPEGRPFDLMAEIAVPVPILVIARILGVGEARLDEFRKWSEQVILGLNPVRTPQEEAALREGSAALDACFSELMRARREQPRDDLISDLVTLQEQGSAAISDTELRINLEALLVGGNLTTTDLIGNGVWLLLRHPDQLAALKADGMLAAQAVEEVLRYESPVMVTSRILEADREVAGCPMRKGDPVWMSLAGANRDPEIFEDPDVFDITRKRPPHAAFGGGPHICIGAPLARLEARHVYRRLFERWPALRLEPEEMVWRTLPFFRGLERLMVRA